jgi:hypothetical protein
MTIKRLFKRLRVRFRQVFRGIQKPLNVDTYVSLDDIQSQVYVDIKRMILKDDSVLMIAPYSHAYYIEWREYSAKIGITNVVIKNGKFSYYISMPEKHLKKLKKYFNETSEKRCQRLENTYNMKTLNNLQEVHEVLNS